MPTSYAAYKFLRGSSSYDYAEHSAEPSRLTPRRGTRPALVALPRSDRPRAIDGRLTTRQVALEGCLLDESWSTLAQLRDAIDAFELAHAPGYGKLYVDSDRYLWAEVRDLTWAAIDGHLRADYTVSFESGDLGPWWYAETESSVNWATPADTDTGAFVNAGTHTAAPTWAITLASGAASMSLTLSLVGTAEAMTLTIPTALSAGDVFTVDVLNGSVTYTPSGGAPVNKLSWFSGSFWELPAGNSTAVLSLSGGATLTSIVATWRSRWL